MKRVFTTCFILLIFSVFAQSENIIPTHLFSITYSGSIGNEEINSKTRYINRIGGEYQFQKNKFSWGIEYQFMFGYYSGSDLFASLRTSEGMIISDQGSLIDLQTLFRGNTGYLSFGRVFTLTKLSYLQAKIGLGLMEHHLSIKTLDGTSAYISISNLKGYDQLSLGPAIKQQLRLNHFGAKKRINCYIEVFCEEAFLQNLRKYNYFNNSVDTKNHFNFTAGIQFGWMIPFLNSDPEEDF